MDLFALLTGTPQPGGSWFAPNGTATTARPLSAGDAACSAACETVASTIASAGTGVTLWTRPWNIRIGEEKLWPEGERPNASAAHTLIVVRMLSTVADDLSLTGTLTFRELI